LRAARDGVLQYSGNGARVALVYNTKEEVDALVAALHKAKLMLG
jgi:selenocysteine lyase/cysteine desulfurase